jgi:hypothetical protein
MSNSSVPLQCTEGLLIRVQPNTYIEKTEHFWTASHLVKQRGQLNKGYNTQEVWEIQPSFAGVYCVFSGLCDKPHWQDFPSNRSVIKELLGPAALMVARTTRRELMMRLPLEGTTKEDVMQMVEATAMVYKVMEEQHNVDSLVPKEPAILKDEMHLNEFALQLCHTHGIPERDRNGHLANIFEMNTSIATLSVQCGDENSLYLEGNRVKPQGFSCHVDDKNDPEYCGVWVVYKHVQDPKSHLWFHVGNVFSYRKSCGDYMKRLSNGRYLKEWQLGLYMEHLQCLMTSTELNTRISRMNLFQGYHSLTRLLVASVH